MTETLVTDATLLIDDTVANVVTNICILTDMKVLYYNIIYTYIINVAIML